MVRELGVTPTSTNVMAFFKTLISSFDLGAKPVMFKKLHNNKHKARQIKKTK